MLHDPALTAAPCNEPAMRATYLLQNATHCSHCVQLRQSGLGLLPHVWAGLGRGWGSHCYHSLPVCLLCHHVLPDGEEGHPAAAAHAPYPKAGASAAHLAGKLLLSTSLAHLPVLVTGTCPRIAQHGPLPWCLASLLAHLAQEWFARSAGRCP